MLFAIICHDKLDQATTRAEHRDDHMAYLHQHKDRMFTVGPLIAEDASHSVGSLLVMEFDDRAQAEDFTRNDPFNQAGIFESVEIRPYKPLLGRAGS